MNGICKLDSDWLPYNYCTSESDLGQWMKVKTNLRRTQVRKGQQHFRGRKQKERHIFYY